MNWLYIMWKHGIMNSLEIETSCSDNWKYFHQLHEIWVWNIFLMIFIDFFTSLYFFTPLHDLNAINNFKVKDEDGRHGIVANVMRFKCYWWRFPSLLYSHKKKTVHFNVFIEWNRIKYCFLHTYFEVFILTNVSN